MKSELDQIKEKIENNDIISFDIFDTLVFRNVLKPKEIFSIVESTYKDKDVIKGFKKARIDAENKARIFSKKEDITIKEIYKQLESKLGKECEDVQKFEMEIEKEFIVVNPFMKQVFDYAIKKGKKVYIISDMYLSADFLETVLKKIGYKGYEKLFVSGDIGKTKATGSIYEYVKKDQKIKGKWLHIGDNLHSDIANAKDKGLSTYYYKPPIERIKLTSKMSIKESIMNAIQINSTRNGLEVESFSKIGTECISSIFYGFADWMSKFTESQDNLIFLSRDGYFPKKVFELVKKERNLDIYTKYLLTSRKAFQIPAYALMEKNKVIDVLTQWNAQLNHKLAIKDIYKQVGLDAKDFEREINMLGLKNSNTILNFENREKVKKLLALTYIKIKKSLDSKLNLVEEYLKQEGIDKFEQLNIVDIGWRGSIHNAMQKILDNNIIGFYFGTTEFVYDEIKSNTFGYYFDLGFPVENKQFGLDNIMMFELIFNSPEQSLNGFKKEDGKIVPVFSDKKNTYGKNLGLMQDAALKTIEEYLKYDKYLTGVSTKSCMKNYINFICEKKYEDLIAFKNFTKEIGMDDGEYGYVLEVTKEEFLSNHKKVISNSKYSLWPNTFVIKGIKTEKEYNEFLEKNNIRIKQNNKKLYHAADYMYMLGRYPVNFIKNIFMSKAEKDNECGE